MLECIKKESCYILTLECMAIRIEEKMLGSRRYYTPSYIVVYICSIDPYSLMKSCRTRYDNKQKIWGEDGNKGVRSRGSIRYVLNRSRPIGSTRVGLFICPG